MISITTSVHKSDAGGSIQFFDCPVVPRVGENFSISVSRDGNGDYNEGGEVKAKFAGVVIRVDYHYEQRGRDESSFRNTLYIDVWLRDANE